MTNSTYDESDLTELQLKQEKDIHSNLLKLWNGDEFKKLRAKHRRIMRNIKMNKSVQ